MALDEQLACGRDLETVWAGIDREPDEHERDCPTCTAARASLLTVQRATAELRTNDQQDPELQPPPQLAATIKSLARSQIRRDRTFVIAAHSDGAVTASEWAVVQTIRRELESSPDLLVQRVLVESTPHGSLTITIRLALRLGASAPVVADQVRQRVLPMLAAQFERAVDRVDVEVRDVRE